MSTLFAFFHHVLAFTLVGALAIEFILLGQDLSHAAAKRLLKTDTVLGAAAGLLLAVGLCRVFFFEKGETYYFTSHAFIAKLTIFLLVALLSITPTIEFLSWRAAIAAGQAPTVNAKKLRIIRLIIHGELAAVVVIVLCAAIMARGGWV